MPFPLRVFLSVGFIHFLFFGHFSAALHVGNCAQQPQGSAAENTTVNIQTCYLL